MIRYTNRLFSIVALAAACAALPAVAGNNNPVDPVSNPNKLEYTNVEVPYSALAPKFVRDGELDKSKRLSEAVKPGVAQAQVQALLGQPLKQTAGPRGQEWDYNLKFKMPDSENYMVCQYKLVVDEAKKQIEDAVWRRKQCMDIVNGTVKK